MDRPAFLVSRDRLRPRLQQLSKLLDNPTPANIAAVRDELDRLAQG
jgi:hypothetical protein